MKKVHIEEYDSEPLFEFQHLKINQLVYILFATYSMNKEQTKQNLLPNSIQAQRIESNEELCNTSVGFSIFH